MNTVSGLLSADEISAIKKKRESQFKIDLYGEIISFKAGLVKVSGIAGMAKLGQTVVIEEQGPVGPSKIYGEVLAIEGKTTTVMPYQGLEGMSTKALVRIDHSGSAVFPHDNWRGRVVNALCHPADGKADLLQGPKAYPLHTPAIAPHERVLVEHRLHLGVRAVDLFIPCCYGQRLGIFAGSGVGKSTLMSMIAKSSKADIMVIGLIGERGRELNEFLQLTLGEKGLARSVVVAATSDESAMIRRRAAYTTIAISEYFRDQGYNVLCLMDSVTRFAMALREIYLGIGEPPATRGYPPSVFAELPRLLERAGPGTIDQGTITGLFSVLVEGDDTNEPVCDAVRGILDGHIFLDRSIAETGRFPAINVLKSISRSAPKCYRPEEKDMAAKARSLMQLYSQNSDMIELGAYQSGQNPALDQAIMAHPELEKLLTQDLDEEVHNPFSELGTMLGQIAG